MVWHLFFLLVHLPQKQLELAVIQVTHLEEVNGFHDCCHYIVQLLNLFTSSLLVDDTRMVYQRWEIVTLVYVPLYQSSQACFFFKRCR